MYLHSSVKLLKLILLNACPTVSRLYGIKLYHSNDVKKKTCVKIIQIGSRDLGPVFLLCYFSLCNFSCVWLVSLAGVQLLENKEHAFTFFGTPSQCSPTNLWN